MTDKTDYLYSAFISYRHIDPDRTIARRLQHSIENFHIPAVYRKDKGRKHPRRVFRDSDELSLDKDLAAGIDQALSQSEYLIVVLSPSYKESPWCLHEIDEFLKTHDRSNILCVLAEGEPADVLPSSLTHIPSRKDPDKIIYKEPLCADYRLDRLTAERYELPRLMASMLRCSYDDLIKRQSAYRRKRYLQVSGIALFTIALIVFLQVRNILSLNRSYENTLYRQSQTLAAQSLQHMSEFNRENALLYSLLALPEPGVPDKQPITAEALHSLSKATYVYQPDTLALLRKRSMQNEIVMCEISEDQSHIITMDSSGWILVQTAEGERLSYWQIDGVDTRYLGFKLQDKGTVLAWRGNNFYSYDYNKYSRNWCVQVPGADSGSGVISVNLIDESTCSVLTESSITIFDLRSGDVISQLTVDSVAGRYMQDNRDSDNVITDPDITLYRQLVSGSEEIFLCGCLGSSRIGEEKELFCLAVWNPVKNTLRVSTEVLPPYCMQLQAVDGSRLIAVSAQTRFDAAGMERLAADSEETRFSYVQILCFDKESLALEWNYDTEVEQPLSRPSIHCYKSPGDNQVPIVSLTFDVDFYMLDATNGENFFSMTLPDSILLTRVPDGDARTFISFLCGNHKLYVVNPSRGFIDEGDGISHFPEVIQAIHAVDGNLVVISEEKIFWFGVTNATDSLGEILLMSEEDDLEYFDAGDNLLGCYSNRMLYLVDLRSHSVVHEVPLAGPSEIAGTFDWKYGGTLPDNTGFIMMRKQNTSGQVRLYTYDFAARRFALYDTIFENASFSRDMNWADCLAYYDGKIYVSDPENDNMLLCYDIPAGQAGQIPLTGIPSGSKLAETYDDYVSEYALNEAALVISPDGKKIISTIANPETREYDFAVIDLETGECTIPAFGDSHPGRSHFGAFSKDSHSLAYSTDYAVYIVSDDYSAPVRIPTSGLNVRSMTWFVDDLWIEFSNFIVQRYDKDGKLLSEIELDHTNLPFNGQNPAWIEITDYNDQLALMLVDEGNMNLISSDIDAYTPILYIPGFAALNNESDTFVIRSYQTARYTSDNDPYTHVFFTYPHYSADQLIQIGTDQYNKMYEEQKN